MTDTTQAPTRAKASERLFIDADGNEVDKIELATGARYVIPANGRSFDVQIGEAGKPATMLGIFGALTKFGNVANTIRNDKTDPGSPDDEADAIADFMESIASGQWREPSEGGRGPKYDDAVLADVLVQLAEKDGKPGRDPATYLARLQSDKKFRAQILAGVVAGVSVKDAYAKLALERGIAKPATKSVGDLL